MLADVTYRTFPGFDPASATLIEPRVMLGRCLPEFQDGRTFLIFDTAVPCGVGDYVQLTLQSPEVFGGEPTYSTKRLDFVDGEWIAYSVEGMHYIDRIAHAIKQIAPLVAAVTLGPTWPCAEPAALPPTWLQARGVVQIPDIPRWPGYPDAPTLEAFEVRGLPRHTRARSRREMPVFSI